MSRSHVIKKHQLSADAVDPVALDEATFEKRRSRIPRDRVQFDAEEAGRPNRYNYLKRSVVRRDEATLDPNPVVVPVDGDPLSPDDDATDTAAPPTGEPEDDATEDADSEASPDPMDELRATLEAEWKAKVEDARETAYQEGYDAGHEAGYNAGQTDAHEELQAQFEADVERLADDVTQLKTLWREYIEASEPALLDMTVAVAEALLDAPLPESIRGASARAIAEAVEELANAASLTVTLHPVDYQRLQEKGLIDQLNANHEQTLHWHPDPDHPEGDWSVDAPTALIRHQKAEIITSVKQLIGASPPAVHDDPSPDDADGPAE